jgi:hypothetical protein
VGRRELTGAAEALGVLLGHKHGHAKKGRRLDLHGRTPPKSGLISHVHPKARMIDFFYHRASNVKHGGHVGDNRAKALLHVAHHQHGRVGLQLAEPSHLLHLLDLLLNNSFLFFIFIFIFVCINKKGQGNCPSSSFGPGCPLLSPLLIATRQREREGETTASLL